MKGGRDSHIGREHRGDREGREEREKVREVQ